MRYHQLKLHLFTLKMYGRMDIYFCVIIFEMDVLFNEISLADKPFNS